MKRTFTFLIFLFFILLSGSVAQNHPVLTLTQSGIEKIQTLPGKAPLFDSTFNNIKSDIDKIINLPQDVPVPKDGGGGYTHERHKQNYTEMYQAGVLFQLTGDKKYAEFVKKMLKLYADMYSTLPLHPVQKSNYRGKLFWQGLNECVWLVNTAQAFDCIYDYLSEKERIYIEKNLFKPMVKFISEDNKETFDKIHNHGTWAVAGVGMIGYVTGNKDWVDKALFGTKKDGKSGFLQQMNLLFSPDGYYSEGPYYQRYSLQPFVVFAQAIQNNEPERKIFEYRDGILSKAVNTALQMTYTDGYFFPLNDALEKSWHSIELVYGVNIIYNITKDATLLSIVEKQGQVILSDAGINTALDLADKKAQPFVWKTMLIRDGVNGDEGGIGILRSGSPTDQSCLVFKATAQGMGHGHFDKLSIVYYNNGQVILPDYGAARFLNIEPKNGGHYLPENDSWAKQTIAHNTITVDETSNYKGNLKIAEKHSPKITRFVDKEDIKVVSALDSNSYPGVIMQRKVIMVHPKEITHPIILDWFWVFSEKERQYDLSYYYSGQFIYTDIIYTPSATHRVPLGSKNGYQYLWKEAEGITPAEQESVRFTFLNKNRFYTITTLGYDKTFYFNRIGANDPNFNLRNEPSLMFRATGTYADFISIIEPHGEFNPIAEYTVQPYSNIEEILVYKLNIPDLGSSEKVFSIYTKDNKVITINDDYNGNYSVTVRNK